MSGPGCSWRRHPWPRLTWLQPHAGNVPARESSPWRGFTSTKRPQSRLHSHVSFRKVESDSGMKCILASLLLNIFRVMLSCRTPESILLPEHLQGDVELQAPGELQPPGAKLPAQISAAHSCTRGDLKKRGDRIWVSFYKPKIKTGLVNTCLTF